MFRDSRAVGALLASVAMAAAGHASAAPSAPAMTTFTDPTEDAFTMSVPKGWTVKGGIQHSPNQVKPWVSATSPDGATTILYGDPTIPMFLLPGPVNRSGGAEPVAPYENGVEFASDYAEHEFGSACSPLTVSSSQAEPALAQAAAAQGAKDATEMSGPVPPESDYNGGTATLTCKANGVADVVGVTDVTFDYATSAGGFWSVPVLTAYRTPAADQAATDQIARTLQSSFKLNSKWQAAQLADAKKADAASQAQGKKAMAALTAQESSEAKMLKAQAASENALLEKKPAK